MGDATGQAGHTSATATLEDLVGDRVRAARLRLTESRRRVLAVLIAAEHPLTLPDILSRDGTLAQSSAYRNLAELIGAGVVDRVDTGDDHSYYELADDLTSHHHHLICSACSKVLDVEFTAELEARLDDAARRIASEHGMVLEGHRLDLLAVCSECREGRSG